MRAVPNLAAWVATGNNPRLSEEIARRAVRIRIDTGQERPQLRTGFRHPDLLRWVAGNRGELAAAALTLGRAWIRAGKPLGVGPVLGSYESWCHVMSGVLQVAGVPGFLGNLEDFYAANEDEAAAWRELVARWASAHGSRPIASGELLELAEDLLDLGGGSERSRLTRLGGLLSGARDRRYDSWQLTHAGTRNGRTTYRLRVAK